MYALVPLASKNRTEQALGGSQPYTVATPNGDLPGPPENCCVLLMSSVAERFMEKLCGPPVPVISELA